MTTQPSTESPAVAQACSFGLRLPPCVSPSVVADFAAEAEGADFDFVWIPDSSLLWRDAWTTAALVGERTTDIEVGISVTNFETRHVAITAGAAATVHEVTGGRFRLVVATGDSAVKTLGRRPTRLKVMEQSVDVLRRLLRGENVVWTGEGTYGGRETRLRHHVGGRLPILMAATGPKALATAGAIADGVTIAVGSAPELIEDALAEVAKGAHYAGRSMDDLDIRVLATPTRVTGDPREALRAVKPYVLGQAQFGGGPRLRTIGIEIDNVPAVIPGVYPDMLHAEDWDLAVKVADQYVSDSDAAKYASKLTFVGTADEVAERIAAVMAIPHVKGLVFGEGSYQLPDHLLTSLPPLLASLRATQRA